MTKAELVLKILRIEGLSARTTEGKTYESRLMALPLDALQNVLSGMESQSQVPRHPGLVAKPAAKKTAAKKASAKKTAAKKVAAKKPTAKKASAKKTAAKKAAAKKTAAKKAAAKKPTAKKASAKKTAAKKAAAKKPAAKKAAAKKTAAKKTAAKKSQKLAARIRRTGGRVTQVTGKLTKIAKIRAGKLARAIESGRIQVREGWRTPADVPSKSPKERYGLFLAAYEDLRIPRRAPEAPPKKSAKKAAPKKSAKKVVAKAAPKKSAKKAAKRSASKRSQKLSARLRRSGGRVTQVTGRVPKAMKARSDKLVRGIEAGKVQVREGWRKPSDVPSQSAKERYALFNVAYEDVRILRKSSRSGSGLVEAYASISGDKAPYFLQAGYTRSVGGGARGPGVVRAIPGMKAKPFRSLTDADQLAVARFLNGAGQALRGEGAPKKVDLAAIYALTPNRKAKVAKQQVRVQAVRQQSRPQVGKQTVRQQVTRQQFVPQSRIWGDEEQDVLDRASRQGRRQEPGMIAGAMNWLKNT